MSTQPLGNVTTSTILNGSTNLLGEEARRVVVGGSISSRGICGGSEQKTCEGLSGNFDPVSRAFGSTLGSNFTRFRPPLRDESMRVAVGGSGSFRRASSGAELTAQQDINRNFDPVARAFGSNLGANFRTDRLTLPNGSKRITVGGSRHSSMDKSEDVNRNFDPVARAFAQTQEGTFEFRLPSFQDSAKKSSKAAAPILQSTGSTNATQVSSRRIDVGGRNLSRPANNSPGQNPSDEDEEGELQICGMGEGALAGRAVAMELSGYEAERARLEALDSKALDFQRNQQDLLSRLEQNYYALKELRDTAASAYLKKYIIKFPTLVKHAIATFEGIIKDNPIEALGLLEDQIELTPDKLEVDRLGREMNRALFEYAKAKANPEQYCSEKYSGHSISMKDEDADRRPSYAEAWENNRQERD